MFLFEKRNTNVITAHTYLYGDKKYLVLVFVIELI